MRSRRRSEAAREYRGVFAFGREHEATLVEMMTSRELIEYEGLIDGAVQRLHVRVTDLSLENGMAYFQGVGEPEAQEPRAG